MTLHSTSVDHHSYWLVSCLTKWCPVVQFLCAPVLQLLDLMFTLGASYFSLMMHLAASKAVRCFEAVLLPKMLIRHCCMQGVPCMKLLQKQLYHDITAVCPTVVLKQLDLPCNQVQGNCLQARHMLCIICTADQVLNASWVAQLNSSIDLERQVLKHSSDPRTRFRILLRRSACYAYATHKSH